MCRTTNLKYIVTEKFRAHKYIFISLVFFAIVGLLTGIFVAIKCGVSASTLTDFNLESYTCTKINSFSNFVTRLWSCVVNIFILFIASLWLFLVPVGYVVTAYRMYLAGFNCALLVCLYGFTGAITSILIVLPCQIVISFILICFFVSMIDASVEKRKFHSRPKTLKKVLLFVLLTAAICLLETILLTIFSAKVIFVI